MLYVSGGMASSQKPPRRASDNWEFTPLAASAILQRSISIRRTALLQRRADQETVQ